MRVIGGFLRSRILARPPSGVRPTADRVREALFASLGSLEDAVVLDLYAGTGALGIEALSRGAARAVFVDKSDRSLRVLRQNLKTLELVEQARVVRAAVVPALRQLAGAGEHFDLALLDPPYASDDLEAALEELVASRVMAPEAIVVVETAKRHVLPEVAGLEECARRQYGDTQITRFQCQAPESSESSAAASSVDSID